MSENDPSVIKSEEQNRVNKYPLFRSSKVRFLFVLFVTIVLAILVGGYFYNQENNKNVALEVNGVKISNDFFNHRVEIQTNFYTNVDKNDEKLKTVKKDESDAIINTILAEEELRKNGKSVSEEEIDKVLEEKKKNYEENNKDSYAYEKYLEVTYKMTLDDVRYVIKKELLVQEINNLQGKKRLSGIWFKRPVPIDAPEKATAKEKAADKVVLNKANGVLAEAKSDGNFEELVKKYSEDPVSKGKNGDVGYYPPGNIELSPPPFPAMAVVGEAASKLGNGEIELVEYPFGYAIMKVTEVTGDWQYKNYEDFIKRAREAAKVKINVELD